MDDQESQIRALQSEPFDLLVALDRRGREAASSAPVEQTGPEREWVGIAWRMAGDLYLVARDETHEVMLYPGQLTRVPGAKRWIKGLANLRGMLLPVIDLRQFLGGGVTPLTRSTRVLVVNHRDVPAGLMVDEVQGFRHFADSEFSGNVPPTSIRSQPFLAGAFLRGTQIWPVLSPRMLVENQRFLDAAV
ncbi:MAG: chemotaxis protein CheW [Nevskiaceae bacterium]|nr:chemotaxis protein CheW [Nevskiaceae bacterium]